MNTPQYKIVFDITQTSFGQWQGFIEAIIITSIAIAVFCCRGYWNWWKENLHGRVGKPKWNQFIMISVILFITGAGGIFKISQGYRNYRHIQNALRNGQCEVAEGIVTDFGNLPRWNHGRGVGERFFVNGIQFSYREGSVQNVSTKLALLQTGCMCASITGIKMA